MERSYLENISYTDTKPYIHPINYGKVVKVYDGDTFTIASKLPFENSPVYRFSVRLKGIDCPEMKTTNMNEKKCAQMAKQLISDLVFNKIVELRDVEMEKYGRVLANVFYEDICLNELLCKEHLAVKYDGGHKVTPNDWHEYHMNKNNISNLYCI